METQGPPAPGIGPRGGWEVGCEMALDGVFIPLVVLEAGSLRSSNFGAALSPKAAGQGLSLSPPTSVLQASPQFLPPPPHGPGYPVLIRTPAIGLGPSLVSMTSS